MESLTQFAVRALSVESVVRRYTSFVGGEEKTSKISAPEIR